jgi:hypothetical protein
VPDEELPAAVEQLRELYQVLLAPKTKMDVVVDIKTINNWQWYISQAKQWEDLYQTCVAKRGTDIAFDEFKKVCRRLKLDPEYAQYMKDD